MPTAQPVIPSILPSATAVKDRKTDVDVPDDEKRFVGNLLAKIQRAMELRDTFDTKTLPKLRRLMWGTAANSQSGEATTRTNLIFSTLATMLPHVYAKNPEIAVTPSEAVDERDYEKWKKFCKTAQAFLNRVLIEEGGIKRRAKSNVRSAMATSIGWMKMSFQENIVQDPLILKRVNDMQDNLQRIEKLIADADDTERAQHESEREELKQALAAQQKSNEVRVYKGFAVDRVQTEDIFILDESVVEFDDYVNASMIAHRIWMSDETYEQTFGAKPLASARAFDRPGVGEVTDEHGGKVTFSAGSNAGNFRSVLEVWDKSANRIYTVALGQAGYCREPYTPEAMPQRWYNFYALAFNLVEGRFRPLSDIELIQHLQEEYSHTRYLYAEARKEAIPTRGFRKGGSLTEEDIEKLANRRPGQFIGIEGNPQIPLAQEFMQLEGVRIDAAAYDVTLIRNDIDMMVGLSDASRANLIQAKTATEAEIMRQALMNRVAERQDTNEDLISDMARSALEISLQKFTKQEVIEVVGEGAVWREDFPVPDQAATEQAMAEWQAQVAEAARWGRAAPPQPEPVTKPMDVEAIFHRISAAVRVGSTGRPNQMKEREQWTQLMPEINNTTQQVAELRTQGQFDLADAKIELLRETLRRFDERIDVDSFIPKLEKGEDGKPVQQAQEMAQMQQKLEAAAAMEEQFRQAQEELAECQRQLEIAKQAEGARIAEADAKVAIETENATAKQAVEEARAREEQTTEISRAQIAAASQEKIEGEKRDTDRHNALVQAAAAIVAEQMRPPPVAGDGGGELAQAPGSDPAVIAGALMQVVERLASLTEQLAAQTGGR